MADLTRAEELVQAMDRDPAFKAEVDAAMTIAAKRQLIDARGFQDVTLEDMQAWVESKGGTLTLQQGGRELTDQELAAVAGGLTQQQETAAIVGGTVAGVSLALAASAGAAG